MKMRNISKINTIVALTTIAATSIVPTAALADSQKNKNNWRNIAIAAGALGVYGLSKHNTTMTVLGGLGAAYSGKKYEDERKKQSQANSWRSRYHRNYRSYHYRAR